MFRNSQKGSAIIIAMIVVIAIVGLTGSFLVTTTNYHSYQKAEASKKQAEYLAIEASERLRQQLYTNYRMSSISLTLWLGNLYNGTQPGFAYKTVAGARLPLPPMDPQPYMDPAPSTPIPIPEWEAAQKFTSNNTANLDPFHNDLKDVFISQSAWVSAVSVPGTANRWVEIEGFGSVRVSSTTSQTGGATGSVVRAVATQRIAFGSANIFTNALLTKTVNCMGCHLQVRGDVGTLAFFRPGWGSEGSSGGNSGAGSFIYGNLYSASKASDYALYNPGDPAPDNYFISRDSGANLIPYNDGSGPNYYDARRVEAQSNFKINGLLVTKHPSEDITNDQDTNGDGNLDSLDTTTGRIFTTPDTIQNRLPQDKDGDGERDFPYIDPKIAENGALGTLGDPDNPDINWNDGSYIYEVLPGETFNPGNLSTNPNPPQFKSDFTGVSQGSLVLVGTYDKPIKLDGDIYAKGDIMIKGYVEGQGAVYAGRNVYVLGDILYKTPPSDYRTSENSASFVDTPDALAQADVAATNPPDELRVAASGTIVIGDFTYKNNAGSAFLPISQRQGEDFFTAQFDLKSTSAPGTTIPTNPKHGHFQTETGQELDKEQLTQVGSDYFDSKDNLIEPEYVTRISTSGSTKGDILTTGGTPYLFKTASKASVPKAEVVVRKDSSTGDVANAYYDAVIEPVRISSAGTSSHWITEAQSRTLMGTENLTYNSWRGTISGTTTEKKQKLVDNGFTTAQAAAIVSAGSNYNGGNFYVNKSGDTYRVVRDESLPYVAAVSRIDAFLYASKRVAGKVSGKNLVINGGIIGETVGILAPGRKKESWMGNSRYNTPLNPNTISALNNEKNGKLTINYDFRLRNGGGGFSLLSGEPGRRISFSVR